MKSMATCLWKASLSDRKNSRLYIRSHCL